MTEHAPSAAQRWIAVGLVLSVVGALLFTAVLMLEHRASRRTEMSRLATLAESYRATISDSKAAEQAPRLLGTGSDAFIGETEAAAIAELQRQLSIFAQTERVEMASAQVLPAKASGSSSTIGVRLQLRGSLDRMQRLIHAIEAHRPLLFIERATLRSDSSAVAQSLSGLSAVMLVADMEISALRRPREVRASVP